MYVARSLPFTIFLLRSFFLTQPADLRESGVVEGASHTNFAGNGMSRPTEALTAQALRAFSEVPPPFHVAAAYFRGAIQVEARNLPAAAEAFEGCAALAPADAAQRQIHELCLLGLGRVYTELGRYPDAIDRYQEIPLQSPRFEEALHEMAWTSVRAGRHQQALRVASIISELSPQSALAPEATILQGHLQLKLGRYAEAIESYNRVINQYAPVRDEVDAILTMHEDPVRYFNESGTPAGVRSRRRLAVRWSFPPWPRTTTGYRLSTLRVERQASSGPAAWSGAWEVGWASSKRTPCPGKIFGPNGTQTSH